MPAVVWANNIKIASVERQYSRDLQSFSDRYNCCVYKIKTCVGVLLQYVGGAQNIFRFECY